LRFNSLRMNTTKLSVNINKIATLRNARGHNTPNVVEWAMEIERFGANGITVHPRPDERHITRRDVHELKKVVTTEFNVEGYPTRDFLDLVKLVLPHQVTLVPDPPEAITSNAGWDVQTHASFLSDIVHELRASGIRTSIFLNPEPSQLEAVLQVGPDRIELYTEPYAANYATDRERAIVPFAETARLASEMGIGVNAGHDLSLENLEFFAARIPSLLEVSIGHALISDALRYGMENTVRLYQRCLQPKG
jgi:pyridoxine 5-phosphate synthase